MTGEVCWYCYWGWPKQIADIYLKALKDLDGYESPLHFGPSHIVWDDENFDSARWCLDHFDELNCDYTKKELDIVRKSLEELDKLPYWIKNIQPANYDGKHPAAYPPPDNVVMVKI